MKKIPQVVLLLIIQTILSATCLNAEIVKILIQGDTQKIMDSKNGKQDNFVPLMAKLLTDPVTRDADFILQMGDIVESDKDNSDRPQQYTVAREGWRQLDGKMPYVLNLGNNDNAREYFAAFDDLPEPLAENSNRRNFAYLFNAGGVDWLVISMRFWGKKVEQTVKDDEINWMKTLIEEHADKKVILVKHEVNVGSGLVNRLKKYPNVVFVLSGHTKLQHEILTGDNGNKMGWIRTCHHNAKLDSYFRILLIDTAKGTVRNRFYSPQYERFWHDPTAPYHDCVKSAPWAYTGLDFGVTETTPSEAPENDAEFISLEMPCCVTAGSQFDVNARVLNTGTAQWDTSLPKNKYKLGSVNPRGNEFWGTGTHRKTVSENVLPGDDYTFTLNCTAPVKSGYYNFQRQMIKEGEEWFGDYSENRIVYVGSNETDCSADFVPPTLIAYKDTEFSYEVDVADFEDGSLNYHFDSLPEWLSFDAGANVLKGIPDNRNIGTHALMFRIEDSTNEETFAFAIKVLETSPEVHWNNLHSIGGGNSDDDKDGLVNLLEFALGGDPNKNDAAYKLPTFVKDKSSFDFNFRRNQSTLTYTIKESADLVNWSDYVIVDDLDGFVGDTCTIDLPASGEKKFFKLEVSH